MVLLPGQSRKGTYDPSHRLGGVAAQLRGAGVGGHPFKAVGHSFGGAVHGTLPQGHGMQRIAGHIVEGVYLPDVLLLQQSRAGFTAGPHLFGRLEDQVHIPVRPGALQGQPQQSQGSAVAVVPALVGHAGALGAVGQLTGLLHGQGVKVRPEGDLPHSPASIQGVKPASPVMQLQLGMFL